MRAVHWFSRGGNACPDNRDFGGMLSGPEFEFAMVADAAQRGPRGAGLAKAWVCGLLDALGQKTKVSHSQVLDEMQRWHKQIRHDFLAERASYAALLLHSNGDAWAMACGDCRVGALLDEQVEWVTPVHTLANPWGQEFVRSHAKLPARHTLTRCWNAKRFDPPHVVALNAPCSGFCLSTDGYWLEHQWLGIAQQALQDDASCLVLGACTGIRGLGAEEKNFVLHLGETPGATAQCFTGSRPWVVSASGSGGASQMHGMAAEKFKPNVLLALVQQAPEAINKEAI